MAEGCTADRKKGSDSGYIGRDLRQTGRGGYRFKALAFTTTWCVFAPPQKQAPRPEGFSLLGTRRQDCGPDTVPGCPAASPCPAGPEAEAEGVNEVPGWSAPR